MLKSRRFSKINVCLRNILFAKKHLDLYISVPTTLLKRFCSNSVNFFSKFEHFSAISPIKFVFISFSEWSLYFELFFRAHCIHVWHPCCKKRHGKFLVTLKLAVLWDFVSTPRCRNHLQFARIQNEGPDVPQNSINLPSDSFLIRAAAGGRLKTELNFGVSKDFSDFHFFYFVTRVFNRLLIVMNNY